jgi:RNA polymerase sigma-70 factor (ECF subfamily)
MECCQKAPPSEHKTRHPDDFEGIWKRYYPRLSVFVSCIAAGLEREDLLQEIMLKVFENLDAYDSQRSLGPWIYTIARNHCIDALAKEKHYRRLPERLQRGWEASRKLDCSDPEQHLMQSELQGMIRRYIRGLPARDRQIAFLRFYESLAHRDIARILRVPAGTVRYRVHLIRKGLKKLLEKYHG